MKGELNIYSLPRFEVPAGAALCEEPTLDKLWRQTITFMFGQGERVVDTQTDRLGTVETVCMQHVQVRFDGHDGVAQFRLSSLNQLVLLRAFGFRDKLKNKESERRYERAMFIRYRSWKELTQNESS